RTGACWRRRSGAIRSSQGGSAGADAPARTSGSPSAPARTGSAMIDAERGSPRTRTVLTVAGSDSGGGAGIQADLKAFARCGVHGMTAITAITAQSTVGVSAIHPVPPEMVLAQVRAVLGDIGVDAVKVGMLGTDEVTLAVAQAIDELPAGTPVV